MPNVDIDPKFSVYHLVKRTHQDSAMLNHRRTMSVISYEMENATLINGAHNVIFSSFQRLSKFIPQLPRYRQLAQKAQEVYVFGVPDVMPPAIPNITYVPVRESDQLFKEWFLVSYGGDYMGALATEERTHIDVADDERVFQGVWTFDLDLVAILYEWLSATVDRRPELLPQEVLNHQMQRQILQSTVTRIQRYSERDNNITIQVELRHLVTHTLYPTLSRFHLAGV